MKLTIAPIYQFLLLYFVTLGVYYPTLFAPFNSLDDMVMVNHLLNQQGFSLARHFTPGGTYDYYRPLLTLTFEIDKHLGGLQEAFMHLVNVLVHAFNVLLVWLLARRFGTFIRQPSELLPLLAALLFALHPIHTEAVNWIVGRTDLLAGTFVLVALYCLIESLDRRSLLWGIAGSLALLAGALCKETALFLVPGACFLLLCRLESDRPAWPLRWMLPVFYAAAVAGYFALRWGAFHTDRGLGHTARLAAYAAGVAAPAGGEVQRAVADPFPWFDAVRVVLKASGFYAVKLFQPLPLNFAIHRIDPFYIFPGILLAVALIILFYRRRPIAWLFLVSASIATSALFVIFTQLAWTPIAERYMYIPVAPFVIGLVYAAGSHTSGSAWQRTALVLVPLLLMGAAWATTARNIVWQDNLTLYQDAVRQSPDFAPAKNQLAFALRDHGRREEALALMAENIMPGGDGAVMNRAAAYWESGNYEAARLELLELLENPGALEIQILNTIIGMTMEQAQKTTDESLKRAYYEDILGWLERMRTLWPNGFVYYRIGRVHLILNNRAEAQRAFAEAADRLPPDSLYHEPAAKLARNLAQ